MREVTLILFVGLLLISSCTELAETTQRGAPSLDEADIEETDSGDTNTYKTDSEDSNTEKDDQGDSETEEEEEIVVGQYSISNMAGTYNCWSYNVAGAGDSCTSPPIVLNTDGTYSMSSEAGTFTVEGATVILSESELRGPGYIQEDGHQIRFEYTYNDWDHVITYARQAGGSGDDYITIGVTILFVFGEETGWINSAELRLQDDGSFAGETLAYEIADQTVEATFYVEGESGVQTGNMYDLYVSTGLDVWKVGEVDLTTVTEDVDLVVEATSYTDEEPTDPEDSYEVVYDTEGDEETEEVSDDRTTEEDTADAPICDPNIPTYSQPGCVEA